MIKTFEDYKVQKEDNCLSKISDLIFLECNEACKINNFQRKHAYDKKLISLNDHTILFKIDRLV